MNKKYYATTLILSILSITGCYFTAGDTNDHRNLPTNKTVQTAPSFDCNKASTEVEKLICSDDELAKLDVEMNKSYHAFMKTLDEEYYRNKLKKKQREWLKDITKAPCFSGTDKINCLKNIYAFRVQQLTNWAERKNWDFFINDHFFEKDYSAVTNNGEKIYVGYINSVPRLEGAITKVYYYPRISNKIVFYNDYQEKGRKVNIFQEDNDIQILFSNKNYKNFNEFYDQKHTSPIRKVYPLPHIYPDESEVEANISKISFDKYIGNVAPDAEKKEAPCNEWLDALQKKEYELIYPSVIANSQEELEAKSAFKCNIDSICKNHKAGKRYWNDVCDNSEKASLRHKNFRALIPPYMLYDLGDKWLLMGIWSRDLGILSTEEIIVIEISKQNCEQNKFITNGWITNAVIKIHKNLYLLKIYGQDFSVQALFSGEKCRFILKEENDN